MFKSIRGSFLGWHTFILVVVLTGFGGTLFHLQRHAMLSEIDVELEGTAQVLAATLQRGSRRPPWLLGRGPRGAEPRAPMREQSDTAGDDTLDTEEDNATPAQKSSRLDTAGDGKVSTEERLVARQHRLAERRAFSQKRFDTDGDGTLSTAERTAAYTSDVVSRLPESLQRRFDDEAEEEAYFVVWRADGTVLTAANMPSDLSMPPPSAMPRTQPSYIRQRDVRREIISAGPHGTLMLVGRSMQQEHERLRHLLWRLIATGGGVLVVGLAGSWLLAQRVTRPIDTISATAMAISASDLSRRIDIATTKSELGQLAHVLNTTFARLEAAFAQQTRFTADASHELRTPVSVILTQTELALAKERPAAEYREALEACCRAARRMKTLVDGLLTLARIDAGELHLHPDTFDLRRTVEECVALLTPLAEEHGVTFQLDLQPVQFVGDADRLAQVVTNLLSNAINYNREQGRVQVTLARDERTHDVVLTVADTGMGIAPEDLEGIFARFYRVDKARSRLFGGSGLGLPICQHIVEAHGGSITCHSVMHTGTTFVVRLPASPTMA
jgi:heavy metal sensor kinase